MLICLCVWLRAYVGVCNYLTLNLQMALVVIVGALTTNVMCKVYHLSELLEEGGHCGCWYERVVRRGA